MATPIDPGTYTPPPPPPSDTPSGGEIDFQSAYSILQERMSTSSLSATKTEQCLSDNRVNGADGQTVSLSSDPSSSPSSSRASPPDLSTPGAFAAACPCSSTNCLSSIPSSPDDTTIDYEKYSHMKEFDRQRIVAHLLSYQASRDEAHKALAGRFLSCRLTDSEGRMVGFKQGEYIEAITEATARFAALSKFVRVALHFLELLPPDPPAAVIAAVKLLQEREKGKLEATAALHLARIRGVSDGWEREAGVGGGGAEKGTVEMLLDGEVREMEKRLEQLEGDIGECRDEVREGLL